MNLLVVADDHQILVLRISLDLCPNLQKHHVIQTHSVCDFEGLLAVRNVVHLHAVVVENSVSASVRIEENLSGLVIQLARGALAPLHQVPHDQLVVGADGQSDLVGGMNADRVHRTSIHHNQKELLPVTRERAHF